ncbi:MAG: hypothetical protein P4L84_31480 [Isosphaeraceae bacterium]|nr:hypothetical protein [Isosphaeraceae bacterium]
MPTLSTAPKDLKAAPQGKSGPVRSSGQEESRWLCAIEDRHRVDPAREGMLEASALGGRRQLAEQTGRPLRDGKAPISRALAALFTGLGSNADTWPSRPSKRSEGRQTDAGGRSGIGLPARRSLRENRRRSHPSDRAAPRRPVGVTGFARGDLRHHAA